MIKSEQKCTMPGCTEVDPEFYNGRSGWCKACHKQRCLENYRIRNNVTADRYRLGDDTKRADYRKRGKKKCSKCSKLKTLKSFGDSNKKTDGLQSWCRNCFKQYRNDNKSVTPDERKKQQMYFTYPQYDSEQRSILMRLRRSIMEHENGLYPADSINPEWAERLVDDGLVIAEGYCYRLTQLGAMAAPLILRGEYDYLEDELLDRVSEQEQD